MKNSIKMLKALEVIIYYKLNINTVIKNIQYGKIVIDSIIDDSLTCDVFKQIEKDSEKKFVSKCSICPFEVDETLSLSSKNYPSPSCLKYQLIEHNNNSTNKIIRTQMLEIYEYLKTLTE